DGLSSLCRSQLYIFHTIPFKTDILCLPDPFPVLPGAQAADCPKNWLSYGSHCYGYFPQELSWQSAQAQCQRSGGHLASILDEDEHKAVATYLRQAQQLDDEDVWIGLSIPSRVRPGGTRGGVDCDTGRAPQRPSSPTPF
uniref:C-type lectin domain-containing protein n=1 Tax=Anolis carolinensis TaxID=28377 RepID=A0A803TBR7_ANOCA